jgi:putative flavoprotein involved in K+ transport
MPFPAPAATFPTKDAMGDSLEAYAARFRLPVRTGVRVSKVSKEDGHYIVAADDGCYEAEHVVVAMASYQEPRIPAFASELAAHITQLHSRDYRNPSQLRPGGVLVVGAGNSGADISLEVARAGHPTWLSGRDTGHLPFDIEGFAARFIRPLLLRLIFHYLLTVATPVGRRVRSMVLSRGGPLIRLKPKDLAAAGVRRVPRTAGTRSGMPVLEDGRVLPVTNVVWCTGFHPGFSWIDLPVFDDAGEPVHRGGLVPAEPGLSFVGLHFLYALSSTMIHGVGRDAERIARAIAAGRSQSRERRAPVAMAVGR